MAKRTLEVAVVGGGVCGLACAVALQKSGINSVDVQLFEAAAAFGAVGGSIGLGPNSVRALEKLGLLDCVLQKLPPGGDHSVKGFLFYSGSGDHELVYDYPAHPELPNVGMQRSAFLDALVGLADPQRTHFNKRCTSISRSPTNSNRMVIHFLDGSTHETDIVIGADGIKSTVRDFVLNASGVDAAARTRSAPAFSNSVTYRGITRLSAIKAAGFKTELTQRPVCFIGPDKHIVLFAYQPSDTVFVAASSTNYDVPIGSYTLPDEKAWSDEAPRQELQQVFESWGSDVTTLLRFMPEKIMRWYMHVVYPPLKSYVRGRVALLGDSAHGMMPHLGAGAGQGLEDALLLLRLLTHPDVNNDNIEAVLQAYSQVRQPRAQLVWEISHRAGLTYEYRGPHGPTAEGLREDLHAMCDPIWYHDLDNDIQAAIHILNENGAIRE